MSGFHKIDEILKKCGKYKLFFKTFWLASHRLIGTFNLFIFLTYTLLTLVTLTYFQQTMLTLLFDQRLDILGLVLLMLGVIVNLGMYKYISWFHKKGIYKYIDYDKKHFGGTFLRELIPMIKEM